MKLFESCEPQNYLTFSAAIMDRWKSWPISETPSNDEASLLTIHPSKFSRYLAAFFCEQPQTVALAERQYAVFLAISHAAEKMLSNESRNLLDFKILEEIFLVRLIPASWKPIAEANITEHQNKIFEIQHDDYANRRKFVIKFCSRVWDFAFTNALSHSPLFETLKWCRDFLLLLCGITITEALNSARFQLERGIQRSENIEIGTNVLCVRFIRNFEEPAPTERMPMPWVNGLLANIVSDIINCMPALKGEVENIELKIAHSGVPAVDIVFYFTNIDRAEAYAHRPSNYLIHQIDGRYFGKELERTLDQALIYPLQYLIDASYDDPGGLSREKISLTLQLLTDYNREIQRLPVEILNSSTYFPPVEVYQAEFKPVRQPVSIKPDTEKINPERDAREIFESLEKI